MAIASTNPATGELIKAFDALTPEQVEQKLQTAADTFRTYRTTTFAERAGWLRRAADILDAEADALGRAGHAGDGQDARVRASPRWSKCAKGCRFYAEHAEAMLADEPPIRPVREAPSPATSRSARCWRSCRGTSRSGRCSASPRRR